MKVSALFGMGEHLKCLSEKGGPVTMFKVLILVAAPGQRNTAAEKAQIRAGRKAREIWKDEPNKATTAWACSSARGYRVRQGEGRPRQHRGEQYKGLKARGPGRPLNGSNDGITARIDTCVNIMAA